MSNQFDEDRYTIKRKMLTIAGGKFYITNSKGELVLFCKQKAFKLKEDLRLYSDESMVDEILTIQARNIIDFEATYDVIDTKEQVKIGALQRKGMKSILKDEWRILDENDQEYGLIQEDSTGLALLRRFLFNLIPQNFDLMIGSHKAVDLKQEFNPFIYKLDLDFSFDTNHEVDRKVAIAAGLLIAAIEGRQK